MSEYERWLAQKLDDPDLTAELEAIRDQPEEINDRFYCNLDFGTAGLRGVIGAGTNRMNVYIVQGHPGPRGLPECACAQCKCGDRL